VTDRAPPRDLLVAGHVNVDRHLRLPRFPGRDRTEPVVAERTELGGTATNLVRVAARRGLRTGILARIGHGFPPEYVRTLRQERIDLRGLSTVDREPTPSCTILEDPDGATRTVIQQGPMGDGKSPRLPGPWVAEYAWMHLSTGDPTFYVALARAARRRGLRVAVDPAQEILYRWDRERFRAVLGSAELLFGNRREIAAALRMVGGGLEGLLARVPLVIRTDGERGATAFFRGGTVRVPAVHPRRRHTLVGAGDSFRGGFYAAWLRGKRLDACLASGAESAATWIAEGPRSGA
jgi:sugar/nucleoside kinase (ribokinase family)